MSPNHRNGAARRLEPERQRSEFPKELFQSSCSRIAHDLEQALIHLLDQSSLSPEDAMLSLLSSSIALEFEPLRNFALSELKSMGISEEEIREAREIATLLTLMNSYSIFRNASKKAEYTRPMNLNLHPDFHALAGKKRFELLGVAVSIANHSAHGIICHRVAAEQCGVSTQEIEDLARLVSVVRAIRTLSFDSKCPNGPG